MNPDKKDFLLLHFIVLLWGFTAILGVLISIDSVSLVFWRTLLASIGLLFFLKWKKIPIGIDLRQLAVMLGTGCLMSGHWILFFASAKISTASICLAGMATTSLWTSITEPLMTGRKIKLFEVGLGLVVIFGLYLIFRFEFNHVLGLSLALGSALLAAIFTVINGKLTKRHNHFVINFHEMNGAFIFTALMIPIWPLLVTEEATGFWPEMTDWLWLIILAWVCTVYAYSVSIELMKRISAFFLNLTVNLEPVYGILLAFVIFGEKETMSPEFYLGTFVILLAVLAYPVISRLAKRYEMGREKSIL